MGKIKKAFQNMPIAVSFMIFMLGFGLIAALLTAATLDYTNQLSANLKWSYLSSGVVPHTKIVKDDGSVVTQYYPEKELIEYFTPIDKLLYTTYQALPFVLIPIFGISSLVGVPLLFYRLKLKKPMELMISGSEKISNNDLDFEIYYDTKDEMGKLCNAFEKMRSSLDKNNRKMWRAMEERKKLNAAFSHDLRTPLTVLRGYTDFLMKYLPEDKVSKDKVLSTITAMDSHILRLESYIASMNSIQRLEEIEVVPQSVSFDHFSSRLKEAASILGKDKKIVFESKSNCSNIKVDINLVTQAFENLISNAVQYAKQRISVLCEAADEMLTIIITDDGIGFSTEALQRATNPFYRDKKEPDKVHVGLGLNICKVICEKHGGQLILNNASNGGAKVTAIFKFINSTEK
ncbi:HAMP domain-containing sensor histidine kinase [Bacillota bacterium LX-D]|nr:HAMP domain-containing sensor histidine kinase [Bacillota bacterium LX-D]